MNYDKYFNSTFEQHQKFWALTEREIQVWIVLFQETVLKHHSNAHLIYSTDRKGAIEYVGVYDLPLLLNERHNWSSNKQCAPQLLGLRNKYSTEWDEPLKQRTRLDTWIGAAFAIQQQSNGAYPDIT